MTDFTIQRLANASFYVNGSVEDLANAVEVRPEEEACKLLLASAGGLLARYRQMDGQIYGED